MLFLGVLYIVLTWVNCNCQVLHSAVSTIEALPITDLLQVLVPSDNDVCCDVSRARPLSPKQFKVNLCVARVVVGYVRSLGEVKGVHDAAAVPRRQLPFDGEHSVQEVLSGSEPCSNVWGKEGDAEARVTTTGALKVMQLQSNTGTCGHTDAVMR